MVLFESNTFQLLLGTLAVILLYWLWTKTRRSYSKFNIPPFPVRPWPFVGHFFLFFGNLRGKLKEWRKKGGDIYSMDTGGQLHILVNDFNDIKEIWVKRADYIVNLQPSFGDELLNEINIGIVGARDDNWKEQRATCISILRKFGMGKNLMAEKIQTEVAVVMEKLVALKGRPEDVKILFDVGIANIISSVVVGKRFDYDDPYILEVIENLYTYVKYFPRMMVLSPLKQVCHLPGDIFAAKKWTQASKQITDVYTKPFIAKFKQELEENQEPQNFISAYLIEMKKLKDKGIQTNLDEANLISNIRTFFAGGTDTVSTTILWCLLYMLYNPEVHEKVYQEIEAVVGTERTPDMNDKPKLVYLNAVIMETQRKSSIVPIGLKREVSATFEYGGFTFPKGCVVWCILDSVHNDKKIWGDPDKFRPERFIDQNGVLINREELIPFSIGKRLCAGESFARMELYLYLSAIFQRFKFEPAGRSTELPLMKECFGMVVCPQAFKLKFIDRKL